jgi:DNA-binding MarR family transcriptional regulator
MLTEDQLRERMLTLRRSDVVINAARDWEDRIGTYWRPVCRAGMTARQRAALGLLAEAGDAGVEKSHAAIGRPLNLPDGTVSQLAESLVARGWADVERRAQGSGPGLLRITDAGRQAMEGRR